MTTFLFLLVGLLVLKLILVFIAWRDSIKNVLVGRWVPIKPDPADVLRAIEFSENSATVFYTDWASVESDMFDFKLEADTIKLLDEVDKQYIIGFEIRDGVLRAAGTDFKKLASPKKQLWPWAALLLLFGTSCSTDPEIGPRVPDETNIVGEWRWDDPSSESVSVLQFRDDGTVNVFYETVSGSIVPVGVYDYFTRENEAVIMAQSGNADTTAQRAFFKEDGLHFGGRIYRKSS